MDATVAPQQLFEKLIPQFSHKNGKVNIAALHRTLHTV
jgi:hypothetical protein